MNFSTFSQTFIFSHCGLDYTFLSEKKKKFSKSKQEKASLSLAKRKTEINPDSFKNQAAIFSNYFHNPKEAAFPKGAYEIILKH